MDLNVDKTEKEKAYYYIYNFKQAKYIIKKTQNFDFQVGTGKQGDIFFKFKKTEEICNAVRQWQTEGRFEE